MVCLAAGLVIALAAIGLAGYWLFNPPAWWGAGGPRSR
jgi:hypothetical protein